MRRAKRDTLTWACVRIISRTSKGGRCSASFFHTRSCTWASPSAALSSSFSASSSLSRAERRPRPWAGAVAPRVEEQLRDQSPLRHGQRNRSHRNQHHCQQRHDRPFAAFSACPNDPLRWPHQRIQTCRLASRDTISGTHTLEVTSKKIFHFVSATAHAHADELRSRSLAAPLRSPKSLPELVHF